MVATKAKVCLDAGLPTEDNRTRRSAMGGFKVYTEKDKIKADSSCKKPVTMKKEPSTDCVNQPKGDLQRSEKNTEKIEVSGAKITRRRALADVSNVRANSSRKTIQDGSKHKISTGTRASTAGVNVSFRKPLGKTKNTGEAVGELHASEKGRVNDSNGCSVYERNKTDGPCCANTVNTRRIKKISFSQTRISLPVLRRMNQANASNPKEVTEKPQKTNRSQACLTKSGKNAVAPAKNIRSRLWNNRVSDGFIIMNFRGQAKVDTNTLSKKSSKPIARIMKKAYGTQEASKAKYASVAIKSISSTASSSKIVEPSASLCEDITNMSIQGSDASEPTCNPSTSTDLIVRKKVGRRRSYTSLLVAGAKLLDKCAVATEMANLPSIDNDHNQMEVAEYVEEIYRYYWVTEAQSSSLSNYLSVQKEINPHMRGVLINWLIEVHFKFDLMPETLFLTVTLFDRYLSQVIIKKNEMQLVGLTALLLASKYEDFWHPRVKDLISISAESYSREQVLQMEALILKKLKFRLNMPTPYVFMLRFLKAAQSNTQLEHLSFYLIELALVEYEALSFKPSLLCASALYVARCTLQISPCWTALLNKHTRYEASQIRECAEKILKFHQSAHLGQLKVTYEKYMKPGFSRVATLKPLDKLPL
ncbi:putative cyclin-B3-1 isoform X1 [Cucurbita maxima]|uniref:B-like cyclin n=1 Tax=Cucurbita maxima TaxID=3661 RepID=A0A6J1HZZ1_CUCMA|nr:putative cyclin-B3-1 isoform X1 [Cucurbita maxima]XP_022969455.1 putative cyclin-B3-1 isoform X1 [Cucurbita maxima]XP_022969456.1 putative cyclin-B3-1 isoform X1 [Cucurbita maxima]XP_022969457.1 putative cyclin-B3-1 isoform X1 [Cucurbita maxima]XP_022969458.1 putative cyclin-B3-1 isoform X1 [Cucurbita maxima]